MEDLLFDLIIMTPSEEEMEKWYEIECSVDIYEVVDKYMTTN